MDIGFIGAGQMSCPMISNLIADGHHVTVWNRTASKARALVAGGARLVGKPQEVCEPGGVIFSCLADDAAMDAVFADGELARRLGPGGVHVSMSTLSAACADRLFESHREAAVELISAPVLGRPDAVAARVQSYLIAGDQAAKARVDEVLKKLGRRLFDLGETPSAANVAKINFNFLIASAVEAMAEAFAVVEKSGLDAHQFFDIVAASAFACPLYQSYGKLIVDKNWDEPAFALKLGLKDVRLAQSTAKAVDARMQLGELLEARFAAAVEHGLGDKDWTAVAIDVRKDAGLTG